VRRVLRQVRRLPWSDFLLVGARSPMESPSVKSVGFASSTGGEAKPKARQKRSTIIQLAEFVKIKPKEKPQFSADQMTRGATFNVSDFDPDQAGEGALTDFERNIYNKLRPIARENGKIGIHELYTVIDQMARAEKEASLFTRLFMASLVIVAALVCVNAGVTSALVSAYKDTYAGSNAMYTNKDGGVIKTAPSTIALPLLAAPVLRTEQLRAVDFLTVKVASTDGPPGGAGTSGTGWLMTTTYRISDVRSYDDTAVTFVTERGDEVRVWHGKATVHITDGNGGFSQVLDTCANDIGCAAFSVEDAESYEQVLDQAMLALVVGGHKTAADRIRRRRLQSGLGEECDDVEAQLELLLNTPPGSPPPLSPAPPPYQFPDSDKPQCPPPPPPEPPSPPPPPPSPPPIRYAAVTWGESGFSDSRPLTFEYDDVIEVVANTFAFAAIRQDRTVIAWGSDESGGDIESSERAMLYEVESISHTNAAFAAIRRGGAVVTWGKAKDGGDSSAVQNYLVDIAKIHANAVAFAAVSSQGMLRATWGVSDAGGTVGGESKMVLEERRVKSVASALYAFAALLEDGTVRAWGWGGGGGFIPVTLEESLYNPSNLGADVQDGFDTIVEITASHSAFAARTTSGKVIAWGDAEAGGDISGETATLLAACEARSIAATHYAFAALCADGSVVPWGDSVSGGSYEQSRAALGALGAGVTSSVATLVGNNQAFAAITVEGNVVAWGMPAYGGDKSSVGDRLSEIAPIGTIVAAEYAFAAVASSGKVVAWGDPYSGGDSSAVAEALDGDVKEVTATEAAFAALKVDGSVVTWGDHNAGGNSALIANVLARKDVQKIVASGSSFTALRTIV